MPKPGPCEEARSGREAAPKLPASGSRSVRPLGGTAGGAGFRLARPLAVAVLACCYNGRLPFLQQRFQGAWLPLQRFLPRERLEAERGVPAPPALQRALKGCAAAKCERRRWGRTLRGDVPLRNTCCGD